jgi:hypothetical protein
MRSHALSLVKELHGRRRRADLHEFVNQVPQKLDEEGFKLGQA